MPQEDPAPLVAEAIHNYFDYKSVRSKRKLRLLLLEGRASLLIGLGFLRSQTEPWLTNNIEILLLFIAYSSKLQLNAV